MPGNPAFRLPGAGGRQHEGMFRPVGAPVAVGAEADDAVAPHHRGFAGDVLHQLQQRDASLSFPDWLFLMRFVRSCLKTFFAVSFST